MTSDWGSFKIMSIYVAGQDNWVNVACYVSVVGVSNCADKPFYHFACTKFYITLSLEITFLPHSALYCHDPLAVTRVFSFGD
jgi:hypothetical protein